MRAAKSVCSPPQPYPGLPGYGPFEISRKRASPQPAGEGLGVGVMRCFVTSATEISLHDPHPGASRRPSPQGVGKTEREALA
jgi:hypothetical protein